ncbi:MAG: hypothetical protein V9G18_00230 [Albidovulum sp.]
MTEKTPFPPLSPWQRRIVAMSRALRVKPDGFADNGLFGAHFGATAEEAAATLERIGYRHDRFNGVYRRTPATLELLEQR